MRHAAKAQKHHRKTRTTVLACVSLASGRGKGRSTGQKLLVALFCSLGDETRHGRGDSLAKVVIVAARVRSKSRSD